MILRISLSRRGRRLDWDVLRGKRELKGDGPLVAIRDLPATLKKFCGVPHDTRFGVTSSPDGYWRRLSDAEITGG